MSISNYLEDAWLNTIRGNSAGTTYTAPTNVYAKLHTADPGEAGTTAAAGETTRKALTFGASSGGVITTTADANWTSVSTTETYTHFSLWDNLTVGNCLGAGPLTASKSVTAGDNFTLLTGTTYTLD